MSVVDLRRFEGGGFGWEAMIRLVFYLSCIFFWGVGLVAYYVYCERVKKYSKKLAQVDKEIEEEMSKFGEKGDT